MAAQRQNRREEDTAICSNKVLLVTGLLCVLPGAVLVIVGAVRLTAVKTCSSQTPYTAKITAASPSSQLCSYSDEAVRVGLPALLEEVKTAYFTHNPNNVAWNPDIRRTQRKEYVKTR